MPPATMPRWLFRYPRHSAMVHLKESCCLPCCCFVPAATNTPLWYLSRRREPWESTQRQHNNQATRASLVLLAF